MDNDIYKNEFGFVVNDYIVDGQTDYFPISWKNAEERAEKRANEKGSYKYRIYLNDHFVGFGVPN
jgi:hypothetical protein